MSIQCDKRLPSAVSDQVRRSRDELKLTLLLFNFVVLSLFFSLKMLCLLSTSSLWQTRAKSRKVQKTFLKHSSRMSFKPYLHGAGTITATRSLLASALLSLAAACQCCFSRATFESSCPPLFSSSALRPYNTCGKFSTTISSNKLQPEMFTCGQKFYGECEETFKGEIHAL